MKLKSFFKKGITLLVFVLFSVNMVAQDAQEKRDITPCAPKHAFGLDFGVGAMKNGIFDAKESSPVIDLGLRYLHHFLPYFGVDFIKINAKFGYKGKINSIEFGERVPHYFSTNAQIMMGVRGNTPTFHKCMSGYAAFRAGYGVIMESCNNQGHNIGRFAQGFCTEVEVGLNISRDFFIGYSYNYQGGKVFSTEKLGGGGGAKDGDPININSHTLRLGINIGN